MNDVRYLAKKFPVQASVRLAVPAARRVSGGPFRTTPPGGPGHGLLPDHPDFKLAITRRGTRKRVDKWKTGFHPIARQANVPAILAAMDYGNKVVSFTDVFPLTDDLRRTSSG